jgi:hypothetical protein
MQECHRIGLARVWRCRLLGSIKRKREVYHQNRSIPQGVTAIPFVIQVLTTWYQPRSLNYPHNRTMVSLIFHSYSIIRSLRERRSCDLQCTFFHKIEAHIADLMEHTTTNWTAISDLKEHAAETRLSLHG